MKFLKKQYPDEYPEDIKSIIDAMTISGSPEIIGSSLIRNQLFTADIDTQDIIESNIPLNKFISLMSSKLQKIIRNLLELPNVYIGDIKIGKIKEWQVITNITKITKNQVVNYNQQYSINKLNSANKNKAINQEEYNLILKLLKTKITPDELLELKELCKFHIIRWKPEEVLIGHKELPNGLEYTLEDGLRTKSTTKIDVITWAQNNKYIEMSMNYYLYNKGRLISHKDDFNNSIRQGIFSLYKEGNYFKISKRIFLLLKNTNIPLKTKLLKLFNTDLGILYQIIGDISVLEYLIENERYLSKEKIYYEIDQFKYRLASVSGFNYIKERSSILKNINDILSIKNIKDPKVLKELDLIKKELKTILNNYTKEYLKKLKININKFLP